MNENLQHLACIFCKLDASASISVEHIIPESLGNEEHVLPKGVVCDKCNNYFARKIEGPLLETSYLKYARSTMGVPNKRGLVPPVIGVIPSLRKQVDVWLAGPNLHIGARNAADLQQIEEAITSRRISSVFLPVPSEIDNRLMSRFLGKVAIEALAKQWIHIEGWREEILTLENLEPLRRYVRRGDTPSNWEFSQRRIYAADNVFGESDQNYEVLHEFKFIYTEEQRLFFILAIFGEEFAIDMSSASIEEYLKWLDKNGKQSPLAPW